MWTVIKFDKKRLSSLKEDFYKKFGENYKIYIPKICLKNYKNNKIIRKEINLLGNYLFCYHNSFDDTANINKLNNLRGLKYCLSGFKDSQHEIEDFINKCKSSEDKNGFLSNNFFDLKINKKYKFISGPFTNQIFKIIELQKNKINILMGNIKSTVIKKDFLFQPI